MDQVAEVVVVIAAAVVGFQTVVGDGMAIVFGQDIVRGVEGEHFIAHLGNPAQFVIFKMGRTRLLVGAMVLVELLRLPPSPAIIVVDAHGHIYI